MSPTEEKLLQALALMVMQYLTDNSNGGILDSLHMTAGEWALETLEEHGMVDSSKLGPRGATWTESGTRLIESTLWVNPPAMSSDGSCP